MLALKNLGINVEYSHHEAAVSQHEIDMRYDDALKIADNMVTYRLAVKEIASNHGVYATFMPKPIYGEYGSGMHTHQSLFKGNKNAFFDPKDEFHLSKIARKMVGGEQSEELFGRCRLALAKGCRGLFKKVVEEERQIFHALAKRGDVDVMITQSVIKILAKPSVVLERVQILIRATRTLASERLAMSEPRGKYSPSCKSRRSFTWDG